MTRMRESDGEMNRDLLAQMEIVVSFHCHRHGNIQRSETELDKKLGRTHRGCGMVVDQITGYRMKSKPAGIHLPLDVVIDRLINK